MSFLIGNINNSFKILFFNLKLKNIKYKMSEIMLDIETLGISNNSVVMTIGAIKFNRREDIKPLEYMESFYCRVSKESCIKLGLETNKETEEWWDKQSEESKYEIFINKNDRYDIKDALIKLTNFIGNSKIVWANGITFDCIILENCYKKCKLDFPWKYYNLRDARTIYDIGNVNLKDFCKDKNQKHNALYDCYIQINALKKAFDNLKKIL